MKRLVMLVMLASVGCSKSSRRASHGEATAHEPSQASDSPSGCAPSATHLLVVMPGATPAAGGIPAGAGSLTWDDLEAVQAQVPGVCAVPLLRRTAQLTAGDQNWNALVEGTSAGYLTIRGWTLASGKLFDDKASAVVILGQTTARMLFAAADPIGQIVRIKNQPFEVVGLMAAQGSSSLGQDLDDVAIVPGGVFSARLSSTIGRNLAGAIWVGAPSDEAARRAGRAIDGLLRERHRLGPDQDPDFTIRNVADYPH